MAITNDDILTALKDCYDPELPVNIVDLGLVYSVHLKPDENSSKAFPRLIVHLELTMTSSRCPSRDQILDQVRNRLLGIPEISEVQVDVVWEPAWTPHRISPDARARLGLS